MFSLSAYNPALFEYHVDAAGVILANAEYESKAQLPTPNDTIPKAKYLLLESFTTYGDPESPWHVAADLPVLLTMRRIYSL